MASPLTVLESANSGRVESANATYATITAAVLSLYPYTNSAGRIVPPKRR